MASAPADSAGRAGFFLRRALYPNLYTWYVFAASLDLLFTWFILHYGGREVNILANWTIQRFDLPGLVGFKFGSVVFVVLVCEIVGRRRFATGLFLARCAVVLAFLPMLVGVVHLLRIALAEHGHAPPIVSAP
ncbi:MAG: DUF5658 family protein [Planctomycetota bacterium]